MTDFTIIGSGAGGSSVALELLENNYSVEIFEEGSHYNNEKMSGKITLPHPRMHKRNFVLLPLFEINKAWKHPLKKLDIKTLILTLSNRDIRSIKQI